jgi:hypothetical protein
MGGMGSAELQPRHHSPNVGGSVMLKADHRPKRMGEPMSTVVCSPISHQKLPRPWPTLAGSVGEDWGRSRRAVYQPRSTPRYS